MNVSPLHFNVTQLVCVEPIISPSPTPIVSEKGLDNENIGDQYIKLLLAFSSGGWKYILQPQLLEINHFVVLLPPQPPKPNDVV